MYVHGSSSDRVPIEGPGGTIVHDEYHVFWVLDQFDTSSMTYTFSSNKWTFSLHTSHSNKHRQTHIYSSALTAAKLQQF